MAETEDGAVGGESLTPWLGSGSLPMPDEGGLAGELLVGVVAREPMRSRIDTTLGRYGIRVVGCAATPAELAHATADRAPHVAVVAAPEPELAAEVRALTGTLRRTRVVAVITVNERTAIRTALAAGADGVVLAGAVVLTLPVAVLSVWHGQASVPLEAAAQLGRPPISHRERQVMALANEGLSNGEIAATLCVAESTVKSHLASVFSKLGVHTRSEALAALGDAPALAAFGPQPGRRGVSAGQRRHG
jgi:DNA-binding NarL/FixJ family response regulator